MRDGPNTQAERSSWPVELRAAARGEACQVPQTTGDRQVGTLQSPILGSVQQCGERCSGAVLAIPTPPLGCAGWESGIPRLAPRSLVRWAAPAWRPGPCQQSSFMQCTEGCHRQGNWPGQLGNPCTAAKRRQNLNSGSTSIAHANFWYSERLKIFSMGTSFRLHLWWRGVRVCMFGEAGGSGGCAQRGQHDQRVHVKGRPFPPPRQVVTHHATVILGSR